VIELTLKSAMISRDAVVIISLHVSL